MLTKQEIRMIAKEKRETVSDRVQKDAQIKDRFFSLCKNVRHVFIYVSREAEVSTRGILSRLFASGVQVFVPYTDEAFRMRAVPYGGEPIVPSARGNVTPAPAVPCDGQADVTVVPLCAFNEDGYRIGQGKGCYDRYLAEFDAGETVGLAYDEQAFDFVPEPHDVPLDVIITPTRVIRRRK